jgi:long-chain acyl-CoA synthetase
MRTLVEMLEIVIRQNVNRLAVVDGGEGVSYQALEKRIALQARGLQGFGIRKGDRVALLLHNGLDFVTSYFAVVTLGAIVVPLNDQYQKNELLYFIESCGVSLLITSKDYSELCHQVFTPLPSLCKVWFLKDHYEPFENVKTSLNEFKVEIDPDAPVMYQFSSGSTGRPKIIARTHNNLIFELNSFTKTLGITNESWFLGVTPFSHVNGLMRSMMASMRAGATLYTLPKFDRRDVAEVIEKNKISIFIAVPFMFIMLAQANFRRQPDFSSLRFCISASAPMPKKLNQEFYERFGIYVRQLYGSTETGTISVNLDLDIKESLESVGKPIAGVEVEVFTDDGRIADVDTSGELAVRSPATVNGYYGSDELSEGVFREGYFLTGDLGYKNKDGLLFLVGRKKFFINKGGYKINPHEIEELLENHPEVEEVVVVGLPTTFGDERVKAVIVPKSHLTADEIIEHCRGKIADFKIPSLIEFRDSLPKSPTGKIRRNMLMEVQ